jgi:alpha-tubulin suppressor-like RCC1 family protein
VRALVDGAPVTTKTFKVDATAPSVTLSTKPGSQSNAKSSVFAFTCSEQDCSFECSLDAASFSACTADTKLEVLGLGSHTLKVRARDAVGNQSSEVTHTWSLTFGFRSLALTQSTACAISGARKLYCWGSGRYGQLGDGVLPMGESDTRAFAVPTQIGNVENWDSVVAGDGVFCARNVKAERYCWGNNYDGQFADDTLGKQIYNEITRATGDFSKMSLGDEHGCGIDSANHLFCWGDGDYGKLGNGETEGGSQRTPTQVGSDTWKSVAVSGYHSCAVQTNGTLFCFGENDSGECGQPEETEAIGTPTQVGSDTDWTSVTAGEAFSCARKSNGSIYCWGGNWSGELGNGTTDNSHTPVRVGTDTDWVSVSAHGSGACGIKSNGQIFCWGTNESGQLGRTDLGLSVSTPSRVAIEQEVTGVFGVNARCAMTSGDQIHCWGDNTNSNGALGRGVKGSESDWLALDSGYTALSISSANAGDPSGGGCGIKQDGKLYCWGLGNFVGLPNTRLALTPTLISENSGWTAIDVLTSTSPIASQGSETYGHACGIRNGELSCWGLNGYGQLGVGDTNDHGVPTAVTTVADPWSMVSVGTFSSCGITTAKKLYCWGRNSDGQLGQGDSTQRSSPTQVGSLQDWDKVEINGGHVVAHRENGTIWQWGSYAGSTPVQADGGNGLTATSDWIDAKPSSNFWCGIKSGGALSCRVLTGALQQAATVTNAQSLFKLNSQNCGKRSNGNLFCINNTGDGWVETVAPYFVAPSGSDWVSVERTSTLGCGLKTDGQRVCLGTRRAGSFGDGVDERVPMSVILPQ